MQWQVIKKKGHKNFELHQILFDFSSQSIPNKAKLRVADFIEIFAQAEFPPFPILQLQIDFMMV